MKKTGKTLILLLALGAIIGINSCKKEENASCTNGSFTATVNGAAFSGSSYNNTIVRAVSNGVKTKRLDIRATASDGKKIILTINNLKDAASGKCMRSAVYYNDPTLNYTDGTNYEGIIGTYMTSASSVAGQTMPIPGESGSITITSCNETDMQISGSFSFKTTSFGGGTEYTITGTFTNMCYSFTE